MSTLLDTAKSYSQTVVDQASAAADKVAHAIDPHLAVLDQFVEGAVVILISRSSGQALEVVEVSGRTNWFKKNLQKMGVLGYGDLTVDGKGGKGEDADRAHWTVVDLGGRNVRLHCQKNYLCIVDGTTKVMRYTDPENVGEETALRLSHNEQFVIIESCQKMGHHVGILADGSLKSAMATGTENDACFAVKLVSSPPAEAVGENDTAETKTDSK